MNPAEIYNQLLQTSYFEIAGFATSLLGVWLAARENVWTWPVGLAGVLLSLYVFYQSRLYADMSLQVFYIGITGYGWYQWLYGGRRHEGLPVSRSSARVLAGVLVLGVLLSPAVGYLFQRYTQADLPYLDSALAVFSLLVTWMMGRKLIEHWLFWIVIDLAYTGLFFYKQLYLYSLLYLLFTVLAAFGYREWQRKSADSAPATA